MVPRLKSLAATVIALLLVALCLWAAQWQYHRGGARHALNTQITSQVNSPPVPFAALLTQPQSHEWQKTTLSGKFISGKQVLLRNQYSNGAFGYHLLQLFQEVGGSEIWVNRGWIPAGKSAIAAPVLPKEDLTETTLIGRVRLDRTLPHGSFFALPTRNQSGLIKQWNAANSLTTPAVPFYLDLLSASSKNLVPQSPVELPELSDGPHMAYALQWLFFAGLVLYGRFLITRR